MDRRETIDGFHRLYYDSRVWGRTRWLGVDVEKCPLDLWIYQEILFEKRPDVIIECGTRFGGSALYMASVCDLLGHGRLISIDIGNLHEAVKHPRIEFTTGNSVDEQTVAAVRACLQPAETVMAVLDSDHHFEHVLREMEVYGSVVTPGQYLIVEDGNINGHPVAEQHGAGPAEAIAAFLPAHPEFAADRSREKFFLTFNPDGYLLKAG